MLCCFTAARVKCRTAVVKRLPVIHHSADCGLGIIEHMLVALKMEYPFSRFHEAYVASQTTLLHMKRLDKTEFPIFFCVSFISNLIDLFEHIVALFVVFLWSSFISPLSHLLCFMIVFVFICVSMRCSILYAD